jgi:hypothetical protein
MLMIMLSHGESSCLTSDRSRHAWGLREWTRCGHYGAHPFLRGAADREQKTLRSTDTSRGGGLFLSHMRGGAELTKCTFEVFVGDMAMPGDTVVLIGSGRLWHDWDVNRAIALKRKRAGGW